MTQAMADTPAQSTDTITEPSPSAGPVGARHASPLQETGEGQGRELQATSPAASRCRFYRLLASAFAFPDHEFFEDIGNGRFRSAVEECARSLPYALEASLPTDPLPPAYDDFEAEYIRLFEVGLGGGPPCPLYAGEYLGARMKTMEEHLRFYNFFGLKLNEGDGRELPDHLTVELEFMHFLSFQEAQAPADPESIQSLRHAQSDFLDRQPVRWLPLLAKKLAGQKPPPFYATLVEMTERFMKQDLGYLRAT
ncbi:MAG: molecular chaperone TorD family protein [Nitrospirae bacterium]|nr:molecular chaperone TorD family protein [Nitrospirota bacterium]